MAGSQVLRGRPLFLGGGAGVGSSSVALSLVLGGSGTTDGVTQLDSSTLPRKGDSLEAWTVYCLP